MNGDKLPVVVGITGGSGAMIARQVIALLLDLGYPVIGTATKAGRRVWVEELGSDLSAALRQWAAPMSDRGSLAWHSINDVGAPIASGSVETQGMIVVPASMGTIAGIAAGIEDNLVLRAAGVTLKEWRPLVLVPRESPLSAIHLENLLRLARLGVRVIPPMPAFYLRPVTMADVVNQLVPRLLLALGITEARSRLVAYAPEPPRSDRA
ncbi:MAG: UbiX family flavin prenyltransferase [Chloroflexota bacterium]|nr:UbiX family flavin prenyltransferase [Chloroflexota bacterium]